MNVFQPISTKRLILRQLGRDDKMALFAYRSKPEIYRYQSFKPVLPSDADAFFDKIAVVPNTPDTWFQLAVCLKPDERLIGDIGLHFLGDKLSQDEQVEIGFTLAPQFQRQGYAAESLLAVFNYIFNDLKKKKSSLVLRLKTSNRSVY